jgi:hypothetical protein
MCWNQLPICMEASVNIAKFDDGELGICFETLQQTSKAHGV